MEIKTWEYYKHAAISSLQPHETPNLTAIEDGSVWKVGGREKVFFANWTSDFDCIESKNWWYEIKDTPFDIGQLRSKCRYVVKQGEKNFDVTMIDPARYAEELYEVQVASYGAYPKKYRPTVIRDEFTAKLVADSQKPECRYYGAFFRETGKLCGYALFCDHTCYGSRVGHLLSQKTIPEYEKYQINAALVYKILQDYNEQLKDGYYICDGARNVVHETHFQDYLEKYFNFRKAYCRLNIVYHPQIRWIVKGLYPFRTILEKLDSIGLVHKINGVLLMESCVRGDI